jgi:amino acid transporter
MDIAVIGSGGQDGLQFRDFTPASSQGGPMAIALLFALTGFIGYEAAAVFRDEARTPEKTIPRATYAAVLIIGVFYAISTWVLVQAWGSDQVRATVNKALASGGNLMLDTSDRYVGTAVTDVMRVLLVTSLFACVLSFHNVITRYQFVLAQRRIMPALLGHVHSVHKSPSTSSLVQTATAAGLVAIFAVSGVDPLVGVFGSMAGVATTGMVLMMILTSLSVIAYFARHPEQARGRRVQTTIAPVLGTAGLLIAGYVVIDNFSLVTGAGSRLNVLLVAVVIVAFVLGLVLPQHRRLADGRGGQALVSSDDRSVNPRS